MLYKANPRVTFLIAILIKVQLNLVFACLWVKLEHPAFLEEVMKFFDCCILWQPGNIDVWVIFTFKPLLFSIFLVSLTF